MITKILLAYASTHGSTQEVAEVVAATLREYELEVDIQPARNIRSLKGYSAIVLGAPIYMFHLNKDAVRFLSQQQKTLADGLPIAIFTGGPFGTAQEKDWLEIRRQLDQELAKFSWLHPIAIELIGGKFDPARLHFPWNLIPALRQMPPSDLRDWEKIRAWAKSMAAQLQPALSV